MKTFICKTCGKTSYSSAAIENQTKSGCPTCGGEVEAKK